jgi:hypothetical protein
MAILDSQGRLFGRVSLLDMAAVLIIVLVIIGIFLAPGQGGSVAQVGTITKPVEIDVWARGLSVKNSKVLMDDLLAEGTTNIIIRNQPYGQVKVLAVNITPRTIAVPQPNGTLAALPDPRPESNYNVDFMMTLGGQAQITKDGPVLGNNKMKIGVPIELEGKTYDFNASVIEVRIKER